MIIRVVLIFLVLMLALAMFGKWRINLPGPGPKKRLDARKCPKCGAYRIGKGPCACGYGA